MGYSTNESKITVENSMKDKSWMHIIDSMYMARKYHLQKTGEMGSVFSVSGFESNAWNHMWSGFEKHYKEVIDERFDYHHCRANQPDRNEVMVHLKEGITIHRNMVDSVEMIYGSSSDTGWVNDLKARFRKLLDDRATHQMGLIRTHSGRLDVQFCDYNLYGLNLIPFLGKETETFFEEMVRSLSSDFGVGLYLLHGPPGTGKTSFLKQVLHKAGKKVLYLSPSFSEELTSPNLISLLLDYPDSILVIEDAETALMKRAADNSNSVSNLLNLTDGFLSDFLKLKIICTFNSDLEEMDPALLREGRLKGIHQFGKVGPERAEQIAEALGRELPEAKPMTLAEICGGRAIGSTQRNMLEKSRVGFAN
ncbi:MAG: AAA family ATPase [Balneolaceae bacterium]